MSEVIQRKRRLASMVNGVATLAVASVMAAGLAILFEGLILLIGAFGGNVDWLRSWVDVKLTSVQEWLTGIPVAAVLSPDILAYLPPGGVSRDLLALVTAFFVICLYPARRVGPALMAQFDDETFRRAPEADFGMRWAGPLGDHQKAGWDWLHQWCFAGVGSGRSPILHPWVLPQVEKRFCIAVLVGSNGTGKSHLAEAYSLHLDGTVRINALFGPTDRFIFRLRSKVQSWLWYRTRAISDLWDCGYIIEDFAARAGLEKFSPRRPTLLIADQLLPETLTESIKVLNGRRVGFRHPVRLLVVDVTIPSALGLRWDGGTKSWSTPLQELGEVPVMSLSAVKFGVAEYRKLVSSQRTEVTADHMSLFGLDSQWQPLVDALEGQPILLSESIRMVREQSITFESLLLADDLFGQTVQSQTNRANPPLLPPDMLGRRGELLRERVLGVRAAHREDVLRLSLGRLMGNVDEVYEAVLIASIANGGSEERLARLLGWETQHPLASRLSSLLGLAYTRDWVPAVKPAVILDEMLRRHFDAGPETDLSEGTRHRVALMMRRAWLLNPAGTMQTVGRWQKRKRQDAFVLAILRLPSLWDLEHSQTGDSGVRAEIIRAFFELTLLHQGSLRHTVLAMALLDDAELATAEPGLLTLLMHPDSGGLPAFVLWLQLLRRRWPDLHSLTSSDTVDFGCALTQGTGHLIQQIVTHAVPMTMLLHHQLAEAVTGVLPLCRGLAIPCAGNPAFRETVDVLWRSIRSYRSYAGGEGQIPLFRDRVIKEIAWILATGNQKATGEPVGWLQALIEAVGAISEFDDSHEVGLQSWVFDADLAGEEPHLTWGRVRVLGLIASGARVNNPEVVKRVAERVAEIATGYPNHEGLQQICAEAWRDLAWAYRDEMPTTVRSAAERTALIASAFRLNEDIQLANVEAWRDLAWAYRDTDPASTTAATLRAGGIASAFPSNVGIQQACIEAWHYLAWAHKDVDAGSTKMAADCASQIAAAFPAHSEIQFSNASTWRCVAWAYRNFDCLVTEAAAESVAAIGSQFPAHAGIQFESAQAWKCVVWAYHEYDAPTTERATDYVAKIAVRFPELETIQLEYAQALRCLAWANMDRDIAASESAADRVADIACELPEHEGIQFESAEAWRYVALAHQSRNPAATEVAAKRVAAIVSAFPDRESFQSLSAQAWGSVAWAHRDTDPEATESAARHIASIASAFPDSELLQGDSAYAFRCVAWAYQNRSAHATTAAVEHIASIASRFLGSENIQFQYAHALRCLAWAYRHTNSTATKAAASKVALIAPRFLDSDRIQCECSQAWLITVDSALCFNSSAGATFALARFDDLCNKLGRNARPAPQKVLTDRERALAMIYQWSTARRKR